MMRIARIPGTRATVTHRRPACPKCKQSDQAARIEDQWYCARCQVMPDKVGNKKVALFFPSWIEDPRDVMVRDAMPRRERRRLGLMRRA